MTQNQSLKCKSVKHALHCIAEKAKGESIKCGSINDALSCLSEYVDNLIGGGGEPLKYHLYAWDYSNGTAIAYSEKEVPQAGDVVFLKEDMEGGKITDTNQLKLIYHVISDADGVITVSEHPEGQAGGYTFNRNDADDYEETVTDVRDLVDITQNGFLMSQKGTMFKGANVNVESPTKIYGWINDEESFVITNTPTPKVGDKVFWNGSGLDIISVSADNKITIKSRSSESTWVFERYSGWDFEF